MGRALSVARTHDLPRLFAFFGLAAEPALVRARSSEISARFRAEVQAIEQHCGGLTEKERFKVLRAALWLSYESATGQPAATVH